MGATEDERAAQNYGGAAYAAGRARCLAEARAQGIAEARIQAFLANNPGDECRIASALAPNVAGSPVVPLYTSNAAAYAPASDVRALPSPQQLAAAGLLSVPSLLVQAPGSNANPLSTVSANSVTTGPAIVAAPPVVVSQPAPPAAIGATMYGDSGYQFGGSVMAPPVAYTAAPGGGSPTTSPTLAASVTAAPPALDSRTLLLIAAAVVVYLLVNR